MREIILVGGLGARLYPASHVVSRQLLPAQVYMFGSRLDYAAKGKDLDLLLELSDPVENPAMLVVRMPKKCHEKCTGVRWMSLLISKCSSLMLIRVLMQENYGKEIASLLRKL